MPEPLTNSGAPSQATVAAPAPPQSPAVAPATSGASTNAPVGQPTGAAGSPPSADAFRAELSAAMGGATGGQPTNMLGQPAGQAAPPQAAPQAQATFEQVLQQHPHLAQQFQSLYQLAALGQQQLLARQQPQTPAPPTAQPTGPELNAFGVPKFDKRLLRYIFQTDPATGEQRPNPFAPPEMLAAYEQYESSRRAAIEQLLDEPEKFLAPLFEKMIGQHGPQIADSRIRDVQTQGYVRQYTDQNTWLWQADQQGRPVVDFRGQRQLSDAGRLFERTVRELEQMGVKDVQAQVRIAEQQVAGAMALAQLNAGRQAQQQADQGKQNLLNSAPAHAAPPPAPQGQVNPAESFVTQPGVNKGQMFRNSLEQAFAAAGLNGVLN